LDLVAPALEMVEIEAGEALGFAEDVLVEPGA
jgi:hypothetical protein